MRTTHQRAMLKDKTEICIYKYSTDNMQANYDSDDDERTHSERIVDWLQSFGIPHIKAEDNEDAEYVVCNICEDTMATLSCDEWQEYRNQLSTDCNMWWPFLSDPIEHLEKWVELHLHNPPKGSIKR